MDNHTENTINITFKLEGDDAVQFLKIKRLAEIQSNAEMARALMLRQVRIETRELNELSTTKPKGSRQPMTV